MPNEQAVINMVTRKSSMILDNLLVLTKTVDRQYDKSFAVTGAKIGDTLRIRLPERFLVTSGPSASFQPATEKTVNAAITTQHNIAVDFSSAELTLNVDDMYDRVIKPAMSQLSATLDNSIAVAAQKAFWLSVGTPGSTPSSSAVVIAANQKLTEAAAPLDSRVLIVGPDATSGLLLSMANQFNPQSKVSRQFLSGELENNLLGFQGVFQTQNLSNHTTGNWGTAISVHPSTVISEGMSQIVFGFSGSNATWKKGDVFTIANVNAANPQTRESTGSVQQFVVTEDTLPATTTVTVKVAPAIFSSSQQYCTVDNLPASGAVVTMFGTPNAKSSQNLFYEKSAIAFVTADFSSDTPGAISSTVRGDNVGMRMTRQYVFNNDRIGTRIDVLHGTSVVRPEIGGRLWGK